MTDWLTGRNRVRLGKTMDRLMRDAGVDAKSGLVNWGRFQELAATKYRKDLMISTGVDAKELSGVKNTEEFLTNLFRGPQHTGADVTGGVNPYFRVYGLLGLPSMGAHPVLTKHVGDLPYQLGRGRALMAALILGPYRAI